MVISENDDIRAKEVWFVYDGECPICSSAANAVQIRKTVGTLHLINARKNIQHPLVQEIKRKGINLDKGMVIKFEDTYYHGSDALHILALLGTGHDWFNRVNMWVFRSRFFSILFYPVLRTARNLSLWLKGVPQLRNLDS